MDEVEEVELDLALSIGGSFGKHTAEKPSPGSKEEEARGDTREGVRVGVEPCEKREILAMRRMEAKKKREQKRERLRESCEHEWEPDFKREKIMMTECRNAVSGAWATTPFRVQHFATVQYLPLNNGLPLPCWLGGEKNVGAIDGVNGANGTGGENRKTMSNGSSRCSSSVVSDYQSSSREDGGSTDSHSHSVHSMAEPSPHMNTSKETTTIAEDQTASASSHPIRNHNNIPKQSHQQQQQKPNPTTTNGSSFLFDHQPALSVKDSRPHRPPKPLGHTPTSPSLPQMPYVSTKGDNGKTVNGFLYKYTKSEVSIVCACHGSTFSPAEFVQHAGGTDTTHPLRHITVTPSSAFG